MKYHFHKPCMYSYLSLIGLFGVVCSMLQLNARAESASGLTRMANELFQKNQMDDSIEKYREALELEPTSPLIQYNLGTALAELGQTEESERILNQAADLSSGRIRRDSLFNLGVSLAGEQGSMPSHTGSSQDMRMPMTSVWENTPPPIPGEGGDLAGQLKRSLRAFRKVILADPDDMEAKHNYEVTLENLRSRLEEEKDPQGESDGDESSGENQQQGQNPENGDPSGQNEQSGQSEQRDGQDTQQQESGETQQQSGGLEKESDRQGQDDQPQRGREESGAREDIEQNRGNHGESDTPGNPDTQGMSPGKVHEPLSPEQMDGQRLLNLLEEARPDQFKKLFRFQGQMRQQQPVKDW